MKIAVTSPSFSKNKLLQDEIYKYFPNTTLNLDGKRFNEIELILNVLGLLQYKNTSTIHLSFGEIKKLELIRLIIEQKKLWILDEPFIGLDLKSVEIIIQTIVNHLDLNGMVIFTSHTLPTIPNINTVNLEINE